MPLVNGLTDFFKKKNVMIFGPDKKASRLEWSKAFMKKICKEFKIPTAKYKEISHINETKNLFNEFSFPIVIKSDGLASGKGVTICNTKKEAIIEIKSI